MNWIMPIFQLTVALTFNQMGDATLPDQIVTTDITAGFLLWNIVGIEGDILTYTAPPKTGEMSFSPFQSDYYARIYLTYNGFTLGYEHLCTHPVLPQAYYFTRRYGGRDTVYFRFNLGEMEK